MAFCVDAAIRLTQPGLFEQGVDFGFVPVKLGFEVFLPSFDDRELALDFRDVALGLEAAGVEFGDRRGGGREVAVPGADLGGEGGEFGLVGCEAGGPGCEDFVEGFVG